MDVYFETERLIIRDPIAEDFDAIWAMRNDEAVTEFTGGITRLSKEEARDRHLKRCLNKEKTPKEYAVVLKSTREYLGYCGFQYCSVLEGMEILYGYGKQYWGNGYAIEAAKAVLAFGIEELKIDQLVAAVNYDNVASDKVLMAIGMTFVEEVEWPGQGLVKKYEFLRAN